MARAADTTSDQALKHLSRDDMLYTRLQKIRDASQRLPWLPQEEPCVNFYKIGEMGVKDLRACLPNGVGKTTAPHISNWLKNGIEDVNQVMSEIRYLECKYLYSMQPDEWTKIMYDKATALLCTVKRKNAKKLQLVAKYLIVQNDSGGSERPLPRSCI